MLYKRYTFGNILSNDFEKEVYDYLCNAFQGEKHSYKVLRNVNIPAKGRYINVSELVITPYCVFTVEAIGFDGLVIKQNSFSDLRLITPYGQKYDFKDSDIKPAKLASKQREALENFFRFNCGIGGVKIKSILVFKPGATFQTPRKNRDTSDFSSTYICSLDEIVGIITSLQPDKGIYLSPQRQDTLANAIEHGPDAIKSMDRQLFDDPSSESSISAFFAGLRYRLRGGQAYPKAKPDQYPPFSLENNGLVRKKSGWRLISIFVVLALLVVVAVGLIKSRIISLPGGSPTQIGLPTNAGSINNGSESVSLITPGVIGTPGPTPTPYATNSIISEMIQTLNASNATEAAPSLTPTVIVTNDVQACVLVQSISVRAGPGKEYDDVGYLYNGECVILNGRSNDGKWGVFEGGWVSVYPFYVSLVGDILELPIVPSPRIVQPQVPTSTPNPP